MPLFNDSGNDITDTAISELTEQLKNVYSPFLLLVAPPHLCNIILIVTQKTSHQNVYIILANLCVSDLLLSIQGALMHLLGTWSVLAINITGVLYLASTLLTLAISVERYVKVKYGLRYYQLLTKKRLIVFLIVLWGSSLVIPTFTHQIIKEPRYQALTVRLLCTISSIILICLSRWVCKVRNKIMQRIAKRNMRFGIHAEELNMEKRLRGAIREMLQLSYITGGFIIGGSFFSVLYATIFNYKFILIIAVALHYLYLASNPFVYILVMKHLRIQYLRFFQMICKKPVHPEISIHFHRGNSDNTQSRKTNLSINISNN